MKIHSQSKTPAWEESVWHRSWEIVNHAPTQPMRGLVTLQPPLSSTSVSAATWTCGSERSQCSGHHELGLNTF